MIKKLAVFSSVLMCLGAQADGYTKCADFGNLCTVPSPSVVIWGKGGNFTGFVLVEKGAYCNGSLGHDFPDNSGTACWYKPITLPSRDPLPADPPPAPPPPPPVMGPVIDYTKLLKGSTGYAGVRVQPTTEVAAPSDLGAFRTSCEVAKNERIDPIVFPGKIDQSHLHTFFGNTLVNENSTTASLLASGNSTCMGGIVNRSAYWVPSMIDTATHRPVQPQSIGVYYKAGLVTGDKLTQGIPQGLRMIAGNPAAKGPRKDDDPFSYRYKCIGGPNNENDKYGSEIPNCDAGAEVVQEIFFPQCWNGVDLDSVDHKSHMSFGEQVWVRRTPAQGGDYLKWQCPADHPVIIPAITFNVIYVVPKTGAPLQWRLSSDMYDSSLPGGYSAHGDWFNGWDKGVSDAWFKNCLVALKDCHSHLLGDGRMMY